MERHARTIVLEGFKAARKHMHHRRHLRRAGHHWHPLAALSMSLMIAAGVVAQRSITEAEHLPPLDHFRIFASGETNVRVGQSIRLTAEGYYGTSPVPVKARWDLLGDRDLGSFVDCEEGQNCTFIAAKPGTAVIEAGANHQFTHVTVTIEGSPDIEGESAFTDELPPWAERPIVDLQQRKIIRGYDDGRFGSADTLTQGQFMALIFRMLLHLELASEPKDCRKYYDDVGPDHFAYSAACLFWQQGWSTGLHELGVNEATTRAKTAQFLHQIFGAELLERWNMTLGDILDNGRIFTDVPTDHYVFFESAVLNRAGIMTGYPNGTFGPEKTLNRAEAAAVIHRALEKVQEMGVEL